jgi:hypothetical protein
MGAARNVHVGRALSGGGTARRVEGASNYFVDEGWCSCRCAARRFAWSGGRGRRLTFVTISHNFVS